MVLLKMGLSRVDVCSGEVGSVKSEEKGRSVFIKIGRVGNPSLETASLDATR